MLVLTVSGPVNGASAAGTIRYVRRVPRAAPPAPGGREIFVAAPPQPASMQSGMATWLQVGIPVVGGLSALVFVLVNPKPLYIATGVLFAFTCVAAGVAMAVQQQM